MNDRGSPPHTRDKLNSQGFQTHGLRITPAYAGQIHAPCLPRPYREDHPRIRGTNHSPTLYHRRTMGSPPHTRDKCGNSFGLHIPTRITPAYAGQMWSSPSPSVPLQDHPRIRGTNDNAVYGYNHKPGSPPHTRDK